MKKRWYHIYCTYEDRLTILAAKQMRAAIEYAIESDAEEGYCMYPEATDKLIKALMMAKGLVS